MTGISRKPPKTWPKTAEGSYRGISADLADRSSFSQTLSGGYDAIVCAYGPPLNDISKVYSLCVEAHCNIKEALLASDHEGELIIVGGAGSLHNKQGITFANEDNFVYDQWHVKSKLTRSLIDLFQVYVAGAAYSLHVCSC